jgi:hypothetical protein
MTTAALREWTGGFGASRMPDGEPGEPFRTKDGSRLVMTVTLTELPAIRGGSVRPHPAISSEIGGRISPTKTTSPFPLQRPPRRNGRTSSAPRAEPGAATTIASRTAAPTEPSRPLERFAGDSVTGQQHPYAAVAAGTEPPDEVLEGAGLVFDELAPSVRKNAGHAAPQIGLEAPGADRPGGPTVLREEHSRARSPVVRAFDRDELRERRTDAFRGAVSRERHDREELGAARHAASLPQRRRTEFSPRSDLASGRLEAYDEFFGRSGRTRGRA